MVSCLLHFLSLHAHFLHTNQQPCNHIPVATAAMPAPPIPSNEEHLKPASLQECLRRYHHFHHHLHLDRLDKLGNENEDNEFLNGSPVLGKSTVCGSYNHGRHCSLDPCWNLRPNFYHHLHLYFGRYMESSSISSMETLSILCLFDATSSYRDCSQSVWAAGVL